MNVKPEILFPIFFVIWAILGVSSFCFFMFNNNATLKRKVLLPFGIGMGVLLLGCISLLMPEALVFMVHAVAVITYLNLRSTKFCENCGKTLLNQNRSSRQSFVRGAEHD